MRVGLEEIVYRDEGVSLRLLSYWSIHLCNARNETDGLKMVQSLTCSVPAKRFDRSTSERMALSSS